MHKSPHRVVELVTTYAHKINVMRQAHRKLTIRRRRWNFKHRNPRVHQELAEQADVKFQGGNVGALHGLARRQEKRNFLEQVVTHPHDFRSEEHTSELQSRFGISYAV